jgi:long-chain acyl-CoA synthetase
MSADPAPIPSSGPRVGIWQLAAADPDPIALVEPDGSTVTRGALVARINQLSNGLRAAGARLDDRIAVCADNSRTYFEWVLACNQIGLHPVPLNHHSTATELAYIIDNCAARVVVASAAFADVVRTAAELAGHAGPTLVEGSDEMRDFAADQSTSPPPNRTFGRTMLYTSGTTGRPKGVLWPSTAEVTPEEAIRRARPMFERRGMFGSGVTLICGPLYHGAPGSQALECLHLGHTIVLMDKWDSERALQLIEQHRVTHAQMAPIHFHRLLQLDPEVRARYDVSSLVAVTHAGASCPVSVKAAMMEWFGPVLYEYYAASEGYGTSISPTDWLAHPGSVGHIASDGADIVVLDESLEPVPAGEVGTIYIRHATLGESQYLGDPEKTAASRARDGYRTFGDMGYIDPDGWLYIVDRRTDMILSGGVNIYPAEIEHVLITHPLVADCAVIGEPDDEWGSRVVALVVLVEPHALDETLVEDLRRHCGQHLARFKIPRRFEARDGLPYSPAGKLLRTALRAGQPPNISR